MWLTLSILLVGQQLPAAGVEQVRDPSRMPSRTIKDSDWFLTVSARQALWQDRDLGPWNLGVFIEDGVASLYGAVPSQYFQDRAEAVVLQVRGILFVHNRLRVEDTGREPTSRVRRFRSVDELPQGPGRE